MVDIFLELDSNYPYFMWCPLFFLFIRTMQHHVIFTVLSRSVNDVLVALLCCHVFGLFCCCKGCCHGTESYLFFSLLQLNFGKTLIDWYSARVDGKRSEMEYINQALREHRIEFISIVIHNCSTPINCCMSPWTIALCFPLWLILGGSCYYVSCS